MKLVHKIIFGNILMIMFIALVYAFSYQRFDVVLAKLSFVEIADTLNASFLTMGLSEKNYFLFEDKSSLPLIKEELAKSGHVIGEMRENIVRAIGKDSLRRLESRLEKYGEEVIKLETSGRVDQEMEASIRKAGRELRLHSADMVRGERRQVQKMISDSRKALFYFFCVVLLVALTTTYLFFSNLFRSLRLIERTANAISKGNFDKITGKISPDECGSVIAAINSMSEELRTRHDQLVQSRKLASLGILTAGVAHELGNPLNNISMVAQTYLQLYDRLPDKDRLDYMNTVLEESERIRKIVQDLLDFSKPKEADLRVTDMNKLARDSLKLVQNMLDVSGIESRLELQEDLPPVLIDPHRIQEVLVNLLTNAVHAMPAGGKVFLRTRLASSQDAIVTEVEDTGNGIPAEFLANVFDPFFSTKGTEGTGLGLSISYGIVKKHHGKIEVKSEVGRGTTFLIQLPIHARRGG